MPNTVKAVFENGVFRPKEKVYLDEHQEVDIIILHKNDDLPTEAIARLAEKGNQFSFLADPAEDAYKPEDGEPL